MLHLYIDGASAGNPGPSGVGVFIKYQNERLSIAYPIEETNNHTAEFLALQKGVEEAMHYGPDVLLIYSDSKAVVEAMEKQYAKNPVHASIIERVFQQTESCTYIFCRWLPTKDNRAADELAKRAIHLTEEKRKIQYTKS